LRKLYGLYIHYPVVRGIKGGSMIDVVMQAG